MVKEFRLSEQVIQCAFEVSNQLGVGFLESVYENALYIELTNRGIGVQQQVPLQVLYKGQMVGNYIADLIVEKKLLLELKVADSIAKNHRAQVMNYLRATGIRVAPLINFGVPKLAIQRIVHQHNDSEVI